MTQAEIDELENRVAHAGYVEKWLSPQEVEDLEAAHFIVRTISFSTSADGKRKCRISGMKEEPK